jgi:putative transposase
MPRANRSYLPGKVWHITHRCHQKDFLLRFSRDRRRYLYWLKEARRRESLHLLNYMVTSNHVHLLVIDKGEPEAIARSLQLAAGRTAQEYNNRKERHGAFWEDRYHATAVESGDHLLACMVYIDLNMVRAGVVRHPEEWVFSGYHEIQNPRLRSSCIDFQSLLELYHVVQVDQIQEICRLQVEKALRFRGEALSRDDKWSRSVAVGSEEFVRQVKEGLGFRARGLDIQEYGGAWLLKEPTAAYDSLPNVFKGKNVEISGENECFWRIFPDL